MPFPLCWYHIIHTWALLLCRYTVASFQKRWLVHSWCSLQRTVDGHCTNPIFCVPSSFISCALTYTFLVYVSGVFSSTACAFLHSCYHEASFPNQSSCDGYLLLVLADVSGHVQPYSFVCFAFIHPVVFTAFFTTLQAPSCVSKLRKRPMPDPYLCSFSFGLHLLVVSTTFVGSDHNPSFIALYPCFSAQAFHNVSFHHMIIIFFTSYGHVSVKFKLLLSGDTITSYVSRFISNSARCNPTELTGPFRIPSNCLISSHVYFHTRSIFFFSQKKASLWPTHIPLPRIPSPEREQAMLVCSCLLQLGYIRFTCVSVNSPRSPLVPHSSLQQAQYPRSSVFAL